ncbi:hypothetical protein GOODEAATRI_004119 [Goodea atripinnis]|uniref:Uncharacterized protein n=1 Tax=Goodea atripinnis TaxID=208336 RepID=A0ABV0NRQ8_9TELE
MQCQTNFHKSGMNKSIVEGKAAVYDGSLVNMGQQGHICKMKGEAPVGCFQRGIGEVRKCPQHKHQTHCSSSRLTIDLNAFASHLSISIPPPITYVLPLHRVATKNLFTQEFLTGVQTAHTDAVAGINAPCTTSDTLADSALGRIAPRDLA